jgi:4-diphosphocytidyl-2-C-methyl-D-erythritol kinase
VIHAIACAKVNLSLHVAAREADGLHRIDGIFQSISWVDHLLFDPGAAEDGLGPWGEKGGGPSAVIDGWDNLAWRAVKAVRETAGVSGAMSLHLQKRIPAAAGLGGGSADAAAALATSGRIYDVDPDRLLELAARIGSDVPFCLTGGTARVGGTGAQLDSLDPVDGYAIAVVVPPVELATGAVYARWDDLGGPRGPAVSGRDLPPQLRGFEQLANDLYPAAAAVAPALEDWRAELAARWGRPALLTGSGPSLFSFFLDRWEADEAVADIPLGARAASVVEPVPFGWALRHEDGAVEASPSVRPADVETIVALFDAGP